MKTINLVREENHNTRSPTLKSCVGLVFWFAWVGAWGLLASNGKRTEDFPTMIDRFVNSSQGLSANASYRLTAKDTAIKEIVNLAPKADYRRGTV